MNRGVTSTQEKKNYVCNFAQVFFWQPQHRLGGGGGGEKKNQTKKTLMYFRPQGTLPLYAIKQHK